MILEIDTLFHCIITATVYDKKLNVISSKELQSTYSTLYSANSRDKLIKNIIDSSKELLESNSSKNGLNWTENFFGVTNCDTLDISVTLLNNPHIYELDKFK